MYHTHHVDHSFRSYPTVDISPAAGSLPVSGVPDPSPLPPHPYAPPYITSSLRAQPLPGQWSSGLCHCCDDVANCVITCFCPCITFGQIAEIVNKGDRTCATSGVLYAISQVTCFACFYSCFYRSKLRGQYDLEETPCVDCLAHFCCEPCALCQEYRELKYRGFDMGIGWEANMDRQKRVVTAAPVLASGMTR